MCQFKNQFSFFIKKTNLKLKLEPPGSHVILIIEIAWYEIPSSPCYHFNMILVANFGFVLRSWSFLLTFFERSLMSRSNYANVSINSSNLYYLNPNKIHALILVALPLHHKIYHFWERSMHIVLISKNIKMFVNGTLPRPNASDPLY